MKKIKIVTDSSSDIVSLEEIDFASAPLKIITDDKEYIDDSKLDISQMVDELKAYQGKSSTSCPNVCDWLNAFGDAEQIFCVTITGTLSGSYNTACLAGKQYMEENPNRHVFVVNSLSAGPEIKLIVEKLQELIILDKDFDQICKAITAYQENTGLIFMLESMRNLANNGRVNPLVAKVAGLLGIRVVGKASDRGDLEPLDKCRGEARALTAIIERMKALGHRCGKIRIGHCFNESAVKRLIEIFHREFPKSNIQYYPSRGLCSFYAEKGGLMIGFEKENPTLV